MQKKQFRSGFSCVYLLIFLSLAALFVPYTGLNPSYLEERLNQVRDYTEAACLPVSEERLYKERLDERHFSVMDSQAGQLALFGFGRTSTTGLSFEDALLLNEKAAEKQSLEEKLMEFGFQLYERSHFAYRMVIFSDGHFAFYIPLADFSQNYGWNSGNYVLNIGTDGLDYWNELISNLE
jgi:hypothetical protein